MINMWCWLFQVALYSTIYAPRLLVWQVEPVYVKTARPLGQSSGAAVDADAKSVWNNGYALMAAAILASGAACPVVYPPATIGA